MLASGQVTFPSKLLIVVVRYIVSTGLRVTFVPAYDYWTHLSSL